MKKIIRILLLMTTIYVLFISCLPVFDSMEQMRIVNRTNDTVLIGNAKYNNIDSVKWFLECWGTKYDSTWTEIDNMGNLKVSKNDLIPHDSIACYGETLLFEQNKEHKGYFFIIKLKTANNHSWKEICRNKLYDILVVTREMLGPQNIIEYTGPQDNHVTRGNSPPE